MKTLMAVLLLSFTMNSFAAEVKTCKLEGKTLKNIVVPNDVAVKSIKSILQSRISVEMQKVQIKRILFVEGVSIGDGKSICELAAANYNVNNRCEDVLASDDLLELIVEDSSDIKDLTLDCKIGINAKLLMEFHM